jgi:hypothetical protein
LRIDKDSERNISQILTDVREQSGFSSTPSQASVPSQPSSSSDQVDWFIDTEGESTSEPMQQDQTSRGELQEGPPQASGCSMGICSSEVPPGLSATTTPPLCDTVDATGTTSDLSCVVGGAMEIGTGPEGSEAVDKRLLDELNEARSTNEKYKKMLVSFCCFYFPPRLPAHRLCLCCRILFDGVTEKQLLQILQSM